MAKKRVAIILFNLGGPSSLDKVKFFLFNLFYDKAILNMPNPFRWILAKIISSSREKKSQDIYRKLGGSSPILSQTMDQAKKLEEILENDYEVKVLVAMRHFHPFAQEIMQHVENHQPEEILLLPLYPHFSITTSNSSIQDFLKKMPKTLESVKKKIICCYPTEENFIKSHVKLLNEVVKDLKYKDFKLIISAHGLPETIIKKGDPYVWQTEETCRKIMENFPGVNWQLSYQSRVGPVKWTGPNTLDVITESAKNFKDLVVLPVSFVSEHSETLVELDMDYSEIAKSLGVRNFYRIAALQTENNFLECLKKISMSVLSASQDKNIGIYSQNFERICPKEYCKCINERENIG